MGAFDWNFLQDWLAASVRMATPIALAAFGGLMSERSGVFNIALEGMLLTGAFVAAAGAHYSGDVRVGIILAILAGALVALVHAVVTVSAGANQIVSGVAINLIALGLTTLLARVYLKPGTVARVPSLSTVPIPGLSNLPVVGKVLFDQTVIVYFMYFLAPVLVFVLFRTTFGLAIRATGEYPRASETAGLNVYAIRYACVVTSGVLASLGGAYLSVGQVNMFTEGMTAGRGFIALAAVIFGKWHPIGALGAAFLFGVADAFQLRVQVLNLGIPYQLPVVLPYVLALLAVAGVVGRSIAPAAIGMPYRREDG
ncbi:MAG: ABC transporter permease [Bacillota bacterium]